MADGARRKAQREQRVIQKLLAGEGQPARKDAFDLAAAPARKVDVMHRYVEDHASAEVEVGVVRRREVASGAREAAIARAAVDRGFADRAGVDAFLDARIHREKAHHLRREERHASALARLDHLHRVGVMARQRLLADDRLAGRGRRQHIFFVRGAGRADVDHIDGGEQLLRGGEGAATETLHRARRRLRVDVVVSDKLDAWHPSPAIEVDGGNCAASDYTDSLHSF
jgi:hypothetical protein